MTAKKPVTKATKIPVRLGQLLQEATAKTITVPTPAGPSVEEILEARGREYGNFSEHARITQNIKAAYKDSSNWNSLTPAMKESLEMNAHKVGRILNGNMNNKDSWQDIEGYTNLVSKTL